MLKRFHFPTQVTIMESVIATGRINMSRNDSYNAGTAVIMNDNRLSKHPNVSNCTFSRLCHYLGSAQIQITHAVT